jgi:hypothetical protein
MFKLLTPRSTNITISTNKQILHAYTYMYKINNKRNTRQNNKIQSTNKSRLQGGTILPIPCSIDNKYTTLNKKQNAAYVLHESQDSVDFREVGTSRLLPRHCILSSSYLSDNSTNKCLHFNKLTRFHHTSCVRKRLIWF